MLIILITIILFSTISGIILYLTLRKKGVRFIKISNNDIINFGDIEVYAGGINIAINGNASLSSTYENSSNFKASNAINGIIHGNHNRNKKNGIVHTKFNDDNPVFMLDLLNSYSIDKIIIYNRTDCCQEKLHNAILEVLDYNYNLLQTEFLTKDEKQEYIIN